MWKGTGIVAQRILKVGIAGLGRSGYDIHTKFLRQAPERFKIVAAADPMPERRAELAKEFGCRVYKDYTQLVRDKDLDLFVNALPTFLHPKGTIAAFNASQNVVCEKPLAMKVKDMDRMIAAARKARRLFAPFQNSRFSLFFAKAQEIIASGKLGRILHIRANRSGFGRRWDWQTLQKNWGGNVNNTGPHPLDHAVMFFGNKKPKVFCKLDHGDGSFGDADDFALVVLHGKGSPTVEVVVNSYQAYPQGEAYNFSGTRGGMTGGTAGLKWRYYSPAKAPKQRRQRGWAIDRKYVSETLPWVEESWTPATKDDFHAKSAGFYSNVYEVMTGKAKLVVTPAQVRRQIYVLEECHRQNPLPKLKT